MTATAFLDQLHPAPDFHVLGGAPDLMAIAMPQAAGNSMDCEQIAAQLRAAAPETYED